MWRARFCLTFLLLVSLSSPSVSASGDQAPSPAQLLISTFELMCTLELPDFDRIEAKAAAMKMVLQADNRGGSSGDAATRSKVWVGQLTTGAFALFIDEMSGPRGKATGCAIASDVPDSEGFLTEAVSAMKLQHVPLPELRPDGSRSFIWDDAYGRGTSLIIRDFKPQGRPGIMLKVLSMAGRRQ